MNKYKDYIARTQEDRIFLDILSTLESINEQLKSNKAIHNIPIIPYAPNVIDTTPIVTMETTGVESAPQITATRAKRGRKPKGDK